MSKQKIGVLHPGEMGVAVAKTAQNSGHEVYWASDGRSPETCRRAAAAGLADAGTLRKMTELCPVIVSVCPPEFAEELASEVTGLGFQGLYIDANAVSPERVRRMGECMVSRGIAFVDACIIGLPANLFYGTGIPACIIVLDKENAAARRGIFMIDASKGFLKDGNKNRLREQDIHRIVDTFTKQAEQQVLGSDEVAAQLTCLFLGERKDTSALVGESLKHLSRI